MVTLLPPANNILMLPGCVKLNSSISDFVARGRTTTAGTCSEVQVLGSSMIVIHFSP